MMRQEKFDPALAEWASFADSPNFNLLEKCLKMAQILEYPELDVSRYVQKVCHMGMTLRQMINDVGNPTYQISVLNEYLFDGLGFAGDDTDYYNPRNGFLNEVIDRGSGLPISMSILYVEVAKFVNLDLMLVGFPGHVLVKYDNDTVLDPFNRGRLLAAGNLQKVLDRNFGGQVRFEQRFLDEISPRKILVRLARNLKNSYAHSYAYERALRCTDMVLAIEPDSPEDIRDKGILEGRMLNHDASLAYLNKYLEINPNADDVDFILELVRSTKMKG